MTICEDPTALSTSSVIAVLRSYAVTAQSQETWDRPGRNGTKWDGERSNVLFSGMKWYEMDRLGRHLTAS